MILILWYVLMLMLLWSVFYRAALADPTTRFCIRIGLTGTAAASLVGIAAPLYGWVPDYVTTIIVMAIVYMQLSFAKFWKHRVPDQYVKPEFEVARRRRMDITEG